MARKRKYQTEATTTDYGTKELARHFIVVPKMIDNVTRAGRVMDGTEIDRLLLNDTITPAQHSTLNAFAHRLQSYGFLTLKSPDMGGKIHADPSIVSDRKAQALRGAVKLFSKLDGAIGQHRRKKLVNLALMDAPWGKMRHQVEDLHHAIRALDDIFTRKQV